MRPGKGAQNIESGVTSGVRSWTAPGFVPGLVFALALGVISGAASSRAEEAKTSDFEEKARAAIEVEGIFEVA